MMVILDTVLNLRRHVMMGLGLEFNDLCFQKGQGKKKEEPRWGPP